MNLNRTNQPNQLSLPICENESTQQSNIFDMGADSSQESHQENKLSRLQPIIKWAGGKEKELNFIIPNAPTFSNYYEPFVGGGSVFTAFQAKQYFINDKSSELISLYQSIANKDQSFFDWLSKIENAWEKMLFHVKQHPEFTKWYLQLRNGSISDIEINQKFLDHIKNEWQPLSDIITGFPWHEKAYKNELEKNLIRKTARMYKIEKEKRQMPENDIYDNIETSFMSSLYMYFRTLYNDRSLMKSDKALSTAVFTFIRNYAYSGMFRYNDEGNFNVPYGGIAYNHKTMNNKHDYYLSESLHKHFEKTIIENLDFEDFFEKHSPCKDDFVFLDPPYDTEFSTYAQNEFNKDDQRRLANYLIHKCNGKWMLIIKYTPFIFSLYHHEGITIKTFDKKYLVSFMNRNNKNAEHLIITNY